MARRGMESYNAPNSLNHPPLRVPGRMKSNLIWQVPRIRRSVVREEATDSPEKL